MPTARKPNPVVVVGYDGSAASRAAVEHAARRTGADGHLVVLHAFRIPPEYVGAPYYEQIMAKATDQAMALIDDLEETCDALRDVDYETDVLADDPASAICRVAAQRHAEEIFIGSRGVGRLRAILGSVAHDVLHRATCPVLVIPARVAEAHEASLRDRAVASA